MITTTRDARLFCDYTASGNLAVRCYLSIIDALIEAQQIQATGEAVKVIAADGIMRDSIMDYHPGRVVGYLHTAWLAKESKFAFPPHGLFCSAAARLPVQLRNGVLDLAPGKDALKRINLLHELAGLYAWRETIQS
ncbi:hypothetical protein V4C53_13645 [Paraburkholderia azotifigens]|uniref:hypothetical protein n=1 Tax=Paraburkholderia azotifigens TaxID=2057004 RepID=UPI0031776C3C